MDRVHRIGQTKTVHVYRFLTRGTCEEMIFQKAQEKKELACMIMHEKQFKGSADYYQSKLVVDDLVSHMSVQRGQEEDDGEMDEKKELKRLLGERDEE